MRSLALFAALMVLLPPHTACALTDSKALRRSIYTSLDLKRGDACVRLLNASGTVGCAAPGAPAASAEGPLVALDRLRPPQEYPGGSVFLVPPALAAGFLRQCAEHPRALGGRVAGVLLEAGPRPERGWSPLPEAPQAEYAEYADRGYHWNPAGSGLGLEAFPFPVFLLDNDTTADARRRALENGGRGAPQVARMLLHMDAADNSTACLARRTCLPLGGHSVWAALPPLAAVGRDRAASGLGGAGRGQGRQGREMGSEGGRLAVGGQDASQGGGASAREGGGGQGDSEKELEQVWVLAQADVAGLFHERAQGANSPVSGLVAMLAAAAVLGRAAHADAEAGGGGPGYRRRLVFASLAGEPWGHLGSKRLLWELGRGNASTAGLSLERLAGVVEVGSVGRAASALGGRSSFFLHTPAELPGGGGVAAALRRAAGEAGVSLEAPRHTPGLPPASARSVLRVAPGTPVALLSDYGSALADDWQSHYDTVDTIDTGSVTAAALLLAHSLHSLALDSDGQGAASSRAGPKAGPGQGRGRGLPAGSEQVAAAAVEELAGCLLRAPPLGLHCPLARAVMSRAGRGSPPHYVGVLHSLTADPQYDDPNVKTDVERLVWNFLAFSLAGLNASDPGGDKEGRAGRPACTPRNTSACGAGAICAGYRNLPGPKGLGQCLPASVRYVPAYPLRLECAGCNGTATLYRHSWVPSDAAADWEGRYGWPTDPLWTESNWPAGVPKLTLLRRESGAVEGGVLLAGAVLTAASLAAALVGRAAYGRRAKRE